MSDPKDISTEQLSILRHTLGLNYNDTPSRNFFHCGSEGGPDLLALKAAGLMDSRAAPSFCEEGDLNFFATQAGKDYAMARQPPPVVKTLWDRFMSADVDSFTDFLGIEAPRYEVTMARVTPPATVNHLPSHELRMLPMKRYVRMTSPRGTGEWCETQKAAKASYKADMRAKKKASAAAQATA